ncbi:MAG TPA: hypothetical protein DCZ91_13870 [Lachnospiraceae bacterium]|nr:hypothetical protein [Lachnospiraceae bacterium]
MHENPGMPGSQAPKCALCSTDDDRMQSSIVCISCRCGRRNNERQLQGGGWDGRQAEIIYEEINDV